MKVATVRELRTQFPKIEGWLAEGQSVDITKRGKIIARLATPQNRPCPDFSRRFGGPRRKGITLLPPGLGAVDLLLAERGE